jgi:hypothetical protein
MMARLGATWEVPHATQHGSSPWAVLLIVRIRISCGASYFFHAVCWANERRNLIDLPYRVLTLV